MRCVVYILYSKTLEKYYVGQTVDIDRRLAEHNEGKSNFTSRGIPWELVKVITCIDRTEALKLEKKIKSRGIRRYLQDIGFL